MILLLHIYLFYISIQNNSKPFSQVCLPFVIKRAFYTILIRAERQFRKLHQAGRASYFVDTLDPTKSID